MRKTVHELARIVASDITPYDKYVSRRALLAGGVGLVAAQTLGRWGQSFGQSSPAELTYTHNAALSVTDAPNSYKDITTYNNYYDFGTDKSDPAQNSQGFRSALEGDGLRRGRGPGLVRARGHLEAASLG